MYPSEMQALCGYHYNPQTIEDFNQPYLGTTSGGEGKDVFHWENALIPFPVHHQKRGDCVSHAIAGAAEDLLLLQGGDWTPIATEPIYAGSRVEIGRNKLRGLPGSFISWAIQWGQQYGLLPRAAYPNCDLTLYNPILVDKWADKGVPNSLEPTAKRYPLVTANPISTYTQARDVIAAGGVVVSGSQTILSPTRDRYGFLAPYAKGGHATYFRGVTDNPWRPGLVNQNSWGPDVPRGNQTVTLPHGRKVTLPPGAGFVDADLFERMHEDRGELWALTYLDGWNFPITLV